MTTRAQLIERTANYLVDGNSDLTLGHIVEALEHIALHSNADDMRAYYSECSQEQLLRLDRAVQRRAIELRGTAHRAAMYRRLRDRSISP